MERIAKSEPQPDVKTDEKKAPKTEEKATTKTPAASEKPAVDKPAGRKNDSVEQSPPVLTDDQAIARSRKLWDQAIDAEAKGDYAEAVRCYEQIKLLPKSAQQAGLDFRLKNAQRLAGR